MEFSFKHDFEDILVRPIILNILTDILSLFNVLTKSTTNTSKRFIIDLNTVKDSYQRCEIKEVTYMRSKYNLDHSWTKFTWQNILEEV